jgi:phosphopantetheinyl transferase
MIEVDTPWRDRFLIVRDAAREDWFTEEELAIANAFKLPKRREEWMLSRVAAKELAMRLRLADDPHRVGIARPFLMIDGAASEWRVSLSHSSPYAAAAIAREPIGIDVQTLRPFDERAAHLFLTDEETEMLCRTHVADRILHFWCAKEAAWKQRSGELATLKQVHLQLLEESDRGLRFDVVETVRASEELVVAITTPRRC